jgi:hypothetical protein
MRVLNPLVHGVLDYVVVLAFLSAPSILDFSDRAATISYAVAVTHLLVTLSTAYPLGIVKLIPFPVHGVLEGFAAAAVIAMPWLAGFDGETGARSFFVAAGVVVLLVIALTDYRAPAAVHHAPQGAQLGP